MPDKEKKSDFVVTDRRLFNSDGELRQEVVEDEERRDEREREKRAAQQRSNEERAAKTESAKSAATATIPPSEGPEPQPPTAAEQQASAEAYNKQVSREMRQQGRPQRAQDFEMSFDKFIVSIYMSALLQLGLAAPQGEKLAVDLVGARQTIDTLAILQEKTKGNLTAAEESMLQNCLYELRMAYLEVTNLLTRQPQSGEGGDVKAG